MSNAFLFPSSYTFIFPFCLFFSIPPLVKYSPVLRRAPTQSMWWPFSPHTAALFQTLFYISSTSHISSCSLLLWWHHRWTEVVWPHMVSEKEKKCENRDVDGEAGKRKLSQSKIPSLAARLAQLPMGSQPLSSVACSPFALPKFPGGSISLVLSPGTPGCLMARNLWLSPLLPSLGPKILMLTVFSAIHSLEKKPKKKAHGSIQRPELPHKRGILPLECCSL